MALKTTMIFSIGLEVRFSLFLFSCFARNNTGKTHAPVAAPPSYHIAMLGSVSATPPPPRSPLPSFRFSPGRAAHPPQDHEAAPPEEVDPAVKPPLTDGAAGGGGSRTRWGRTATMATMSMSVSGSMPSPILGALLWRQPGLVWLNGVSFRWMAAGTEEGQPLDEGVEGSRLVKVGNGRGA